MQILKKQIKMLGLKMEDFILERTERTPQINLYTNGRLSIKGSSTPIDAAGFYYDVLDWATDYYRSPAEKTNIMIEFSHINSSSSSMVYRIFHLLNRLHESKKSFVRCIWAYDVEDEFMIEFIESIQEAAPSVSILKQPKSVEFAY